MDTTSLPLPVSASAGLPFEAARLKQVVVDARLSQKQVSVLYRVSLSYVIGL
jgi:hypothetical protein